MVTGCTFAGARARAGRARALTGRARTACTLTGTARAGRRARAGCTLTGRA